MKEATIKFIRKATMQIGFFVMLAFVGWNAYLAVHYSIKMKRVATHTLESSKIQSDISGILRDLTDMETGQRGYLLTGNPSYLQPYTDAQGRIASDFASLRGSLAHHAEGERSMESQLESLAASKQAELERSITLRQQGYRHRAFMLVDSNEGKEYMDNARGLLSSMSEAETNSFARSDRERDAGLSKALLETVIVSVCLFVVTAGLFALIRYHGRVLEREIALSRQDLAVRDSQLDKLRSALSNQARSKTSAIETNAHLLLQNYGGFLPLQGHKYAEQIKEASAQMEQLRQDLVNSPRLKADEDVAYDSVA